MDLNTFTQAALGHNNLRLDKFMLLLLAKSQLVRLKIDEARSCILEDQNLDPNSCFKSLFESIHFWLNQINLR